MPGTSTRSTTRDRSSSTMCMWDAGNVNRESCVCMNLVRLRMFQSMWERNLLQIAHGKRKNATVVVPILNRFLSHIVGQKTRWTTLVPWLDLRSQNFYEAPYLIHSWEATCAATLSPRPPNQQRDLLHECSVVVSALLMMPNLHR